MAFCTQPFTHIEIYENGDVFNCCPAFLDYKSIGNIFENSFEQVWNSEKVIELREKVLNNDFSLCSDLCPRKLEENKSPREEHFNPTMIEYPKIISISSDNICNVRCKICRDDFFKSPISDEVFESKIKDTILPIFKNAHSIRFGCSGEPFASRKEKTLMKSISETYPNIKYHIHTNGILGDKKLLDELGIYEKINIMTVSIHSASRWTYNKIVRGGNYDKMLKNLKLYSEMKEQNLIDNLRMIFVVYSENYKEMPKFIELAKKHNANPEFWAYRINETELGRNYEKYSIIEPTHKEHKNLVKILKSRIFDSVTLYPELEQLRQ